MNTLLVAMLYEVGGEPNGPVSDDWGAAAPVP
jgi:hypothetical protein